MSTLFQSLEDPASGRAAALIVEAIGADDYDRVRSLLQSVERGRPAGPLDGIAPDVMYFISPSFVIVVLSGTENLSQSIENITASRAFPHPPLVGSQSELFYGQAKAIDDLSGATIRAALPGRTLIIMGHSRGGAVGHILAAIWAGLPAETRVYTFGAPRAGTTTFAASLAGKVIRYEGDEDAITIVPSSSAASWGPFAGLFPLLLQAGTDIWGEPGLQVNVNQDGSLVRNGPRPSSFIFYGLYSRGTFPAHAMSEYRRRLTIAAPDPFTPDQVADPPQMNQEAAFLAAASLPTTALEAQGSFMPSPLVAGTFFFKTIDRTFGWTETWYATIGIAAMIDAMRALTSQRLAFLSPGCVIYWYRASVVELGAARTSVIFKRNTVAKGTARPGGTVAADYPGSTMDCIVATLLSSQGSKRQEKFRGLPDAWIEDDDLSSSGLGALDIIDTYLQAVKAAGLGIRRGTTLPTDKKAVMGWTKAANGNIQLTVPSHGYLQSQPFQALIRGRTLANPMVRGQWTITVVDANTVELVPSTRFGVGTAAPGGTVTAAAFGADSIVVAPGLTRLFAFNQVSTIKTGKPSDLHHGKKSAVVRHR